MLEGFDHLLSESSWLSWRELIRVVLLSGLFALVCIKAFPRNAPSKRVLFMISVATLMVLPWLISGDWFVWHYPMESLPQFSLSHGLPDLLLWVWVVVAALLVAHHVLGILVDLRRLHGLDLMTHGRLVSQLTTIATQMGVKTPRLRLGALACSTSVWTPTIVLPRSAQGWDDSTLASVLAHELVHIKRRDDLWLMGFRTCVLLYWWLPWIAGMYSNFLLCIEESCDDAAAEWIGHDLTYVQALAGVAEQSRSWVSAPAEQHVSSATNMHQHHLVGRIGRFRQLRDIELDTRRVYWSVIGVLGVAGILSGIEPVQKTYAADVFTLQHTSGNPQTVGASVYPVTHQYTLFPQELSATTQKRLYKPTYQAPVIYPGSAIRAHTEGAVTVGFFVNADGAVSRPHIVSSSPQGVFDGAAIRAVLNSRYAPAQTGLARRSVAQETGSLSSVEIHRYFAFRLEQQ